MMQQLREFLLSKRGDAVVTAMSAAVALMALVALVGFVFLLVKYPVGIILGLFGAVVVLLCVIGVCNIANSFQDWARDKLTKCGQVPRGGRTSETV